MLKLNEAKETGVPFKRQRIPQSGTANLDASVATFKTPATPPKSFATFTSVKSETSFSSQFPISSNRTTPLPPPRHRITENALESTLTSEFADNEIVAGDFSKLSFR
uniref:Uncharacterized protein n=1 Tax=Panagrolaimus superbus TaxID=310955 RepID=A0A914YCJ8_9BILA